MYGRLQRGLGLTFIIGSSHNVTRTCKLSFYRLFLRVGFNSVCHLR